MKRQIHISYNWWRDDGKRIKPAHMPALEETAATRIWEMVKKGYTSGNLTDNIHMTKRDPEDGVAYSGWWDAKGPGLIALE
jgi:hypothetical protein